MARSVARAWARSGKARPVSASARASSTSSAGIVEPPQHEHLAARQQRAVQREGGFSVVAPISVTVPVSTTGRKPSCWARLKRWISSTNSSVALPGSPPPRRLVERALEVGDAGEHRGELHEMQPRAGGEQSGDGGLAAARRAPEDQRCKRAPLQHARQRAVGAEQMVLAHDLVECARAQPVGERARTGLCLRFGLRRLAEHVVLSGRTRRHVRNIGRGGAIATIEGMVHDIPPVGELSAGRWWTDERSVRG